MNLKELLNLYMRVNNLSRSTLAEMIGVEKAVMRRLCEGSTIWSDDMIVVVAWLFSEPPLESIAEYCQRKSREKIAAEAAE